MQDGERVRVRGSSGKSYELSRAGEVYACTCPAWRNQAAPPQQRTCKHLRAQLGEAHETARVGAPAPAAARTRASRLLPPESREERARREAALDDALARFPAAAARMQSVYGMPLPRHLAYAAAFWIGLSQEEARDAWAYLGCGLAGVGEWFEEGGLDRPARLDERLHFRYRCDPPEFVTVFSGNSDGGHWGLWYDDPRELPRLVAHNYARDDAVTGPSAATLLGALRRRITRDRPSAREFPHAARVLAWLDEMHALELAAHAEEKIGPAPLRTTCCIAGMDPVVPGVRLPDDLAEPRGEERRLKVFREDPLQARAWIEQARQELAAGQPLRALFYGRELHWIEPDALPGAALELLVGAYRALGRDALAEVARVHYEHRDLSSVGIYGPAEERPLPPLVQAAAEDRRDAVAELLSTSPPPPEPELAAALERARSIPVLALLVDRATPAQRDAKLSRTLIDLSFARDAPEAAREHEAILDFLLARGASSDHAYARALEAELPAIALRLAENIDPRRADAQGVTPLHRAVEAGATEVVARLLSRGADAKARDARGATPIDRAREIWQTRRAESHAIMAMFRAQEPADAPAPSGPPAAGDVVVHAKFGEGQVVASEGAGEQLKLTVRFADAQRTMLARFLRRPE